MFTSAVIVALAMVVAFVVLCLTPIFRYDADQAIRVLAVFTGAFGLIFGAMGTYFFTRTEVTAAQAQTADYKRQLVSIAADSASATAALNRVRLGATGLVSYVAAQPDDAKVRDLKNSPAFKSAVTTWYVDSGGLATQAPHQ